MEFDVAKAFHWCICLWVLDLRDPHIYLLKIIYCGDLARIRYVYHESQIKFKKLINVINLAKIYFRLEIKEMQKKLQ